jgi:site-specific DNA-methyltransferase (adenine-specific)
MKPMSERTYVGQALKNGKGITWLGDARIPLASPQDARVTEQKNRHADFGSGARENRVYGADLKPRSELGNYDATMGRFPANLLASNSVLDSENTAFSRFFDLDAWWSRKLRELPDSVQRTFPLLIVPKASTTERNKGLESCETRLMARSGGAQQALKTGRSEYLQKNHIGFNRISEVKNPHPTIKPIKLMSYLITLGSRPGDIVLDPFLGSGSTSIGAVLLNRHYIGIEINPEYCSIAEKRVKWWEKTRPRWLVHKVV